MNGGRHNKAAPPAGDTLLMLSGGIDSVYALYTHLTTTDAPIRTHHVHLRNWEGRDRAEAAAVQRVLGWARRNGYGDRITHTQSTTDFGDIRYLVRDHHTWGFWAGVILANPVNAGITKVIRTFHADSVREGVDSPARKRADDAWQRPIEFIAQRPIELVHPMIHMTKAEVVRALPAELRALCWWCRRPRRGQQPCHECHTCRQVDAALAEIQPGTRPTRAAPRRETPAPAVPASVIVTEGATAPTPPAEPVDLPVRPRPSRSRKRKGA